MDDSIHVARVPASTSNCGPGFDTLGLALELYNEVRVQPRRSPGAVFQGEAAPFPPAAMAMVEDAAARFFEAAGVASFGFGFTITGDVPVARGLGSSVTLRAGILGGLNAAAGEPLDRESLVGIVTEIEGHPDNAAASILGGFCVARSDPATGAYRGTQRFPVNDDLVFAVVSPDFEIETNVSRLALPRQLPFADVVTSLNSLACLVATFATGRHELLAGAVTDRVHEPYRLPRIPGAEAAIDAGIGAGGFTGWLSGSGSSVLCAGPRGSGEAMREAMVKAFADHDVPGKGFVLRADNDGMTVRRE